MDKVKGVIIEIISVNDLKEFESKLFFYEYY